MRLNPVACGILVLSLMALTGRADEPGRVDDFSNGLCGWISNHSPGIVVNPGGAPIVSFLPIGAVRVMVISTSIGEVDDFDIAASFAGSGADAASPGHSEYGLIYGYQDNDHFYIGRVFPGFPGGAFRHDKFGSGSGSVYPGSSSNMHTGVTFNAGDDNATVRPTALRIRKTGALFELYAARSSADGWNKFFEFTDATCPAGLVGFACNRTPPGRVDPVGGRFGMFGIGPKGVAEVLASTDRPIGGSYVRGSGGASLDVNGDGFRDVLIAGSPSVEESVFGFHGSASGISGVPSMSIPAPGAPHFPTSATNLGDLNGDGCGEVAFGAYYLGKVFVYKGSPSGLSAAAHQVLTAPDASVANFGLTTASGDVDGDGVLDLAVSATGVVYVFRGEGGGFSAAPWATLVNPSPSHSFFMVFPAGDVNSDGRHDLVVSGYPERAYVYPGSSTGVGSPVVLTKTTSGFAAQVAADDFNRDGYSDIAINEFGSSRVFLYHGSAAGISPEATTWIESEPGTYYLGTILCPIGDFTGDGYADLAASDWNERVYVFAGGPGGLDPLPVASHVTGSPDGGGHVRLGGAGDVNRDGRKDLLVGLRSGTGSAKLFHGGRTGPMLAGDVSFPGPGPIPGYADSGGFGSVFAGYNPLVRIRSCNEEPVASAGPDQVVECMGAAGTPVTLDGAASHDPNADTLSYTWTGSFGTATGVSPTVTLAHGTHDILLSVDDGRGGSSTDTVRITVQDTLPPVMTGVPGPVTAEATSAAGAVVPLAPPTATDLCAGVLAVSSDAPDVFPLGSTTVTWSATDPAGSSVTATTVVTVQDTSAPVVTSLTADPAILKQNNHKLVDVTLAAVATDSVDGSPVCRIVSVSSNEPVDGGPDWIVTGDLTLQLRAERLGGGSGRVYTITVECTDAAGNVSVATTTVTVPHDSSGK